MRAGVAPRRPLEAAAPSHGTPATPSKPARVNHEEAPPADPLDHPDLAANLSQPLREVLRRVDDGDEAARTEALPAVAAIVDAFAALGLVEFAYLAPGADDPRVLEVALAPSPVAWFEAGEAIFDKERDTVVIAGGEILEVFDGPITLEDPPEHESEA